MSKKHSVLFICTTRAFMMSHRQNLIEAALQKGWDVTLITGSPGEAKMEAEAEAIFRERYSNVRLIKHSTRGLSKLVFIVMSVIKIRTERPSVVHVISLRMFIITALFLPMCRHSKVVVSISGFGALGIVRPGIMGSLRKRAFDVVLRLLFGMQRKVKFISQNRSDLTALTRITHRSCQHELILGSGVDLKTFSPKPYHERENKVLFVGRILKDKGVLEFLQAAKVLEQKYVKWQFELVGSAGYDNPMALSHEDLTAQLMGTSIKWHGFRSDAGKLMESAKVVCLPSYREGFPKVLIEGAAAGCALIATRVPGCVDAITDGRDGLLCEARDVTSLITALQTVIEDEIKAKEMATNARKKALLQYDIGSVTRRHFQIYAVG